MTTWATMCIEEEESRLVYGYTAITGHGYGTRRLEKGKCDSCVQEREQAGSVKLPSCVFNLCVLQSARAHCV